MTLSRWRRIVTGVAAGAIVLCAALVGASFRDDNSGVSVAAESRPAATIIPIEDVVEVTPTPQSEAADGTEVAAGTEADDAAATDPVQVIEPDDLPDPDPSDATTDSGDTSPDPADTGDAGTTGDTPDTPDTPDTGDSGDSGDTAETPAPAPTAAAPLTSTDDSLGTGGGVDDAECALDRLVIYAGARRGGVAGSIRSALSQAGFGAGCPQPVTVLASNCPLQFAGRLGAGSGYDPNKSYVASSTNVDRDTMTAVMGTVGFTGNEIDILDFGFVNPDKPGEQWIAIFIPPSFSGWENLASRAGLGATNTSLCSPSGQLNG